MKKLKKLTFAFGLAENSHLIPFANVPSLRKIAVSAGNGKEFKLPVFHQVTSLEVLDDSFVNEKETFDAFPNLLEFKWVSFISLQLIGITRWMIGYILIGEEQTSKQSPAVHPS